VSSLCSLTSSHPQGPALFYVDSDGQRLKGDLFSVGSGSTFAYGVLDQGYSWDLSDEDAQELGRRSIVAAGHRDAYSGNTVNLYHVRENGWEFISKSTLQQSRQAKREHSADIPDNYDLSELWYSYEEKKKADGAAAVAAAAAAEAAAGSPIEVDA
jgi:20S proteasome subunit beta 5